MLAEEFVEGLSEQGLDSAVLHDAEQPQLAVDSRGKVAGDGDGAGAAVPGMAGRGGCLAVRAREHVDEGVVSLRHFGLPWGAGAREAPDGETCPVCGQPVTWGPGEACPDLTAATSWLTPA